MESNNLEFTTPEGHKAWINYYDLVAHNRWVKFKSSQLLRYMHTLHFGTDQQIREVQRLIEEEDKHHNEIYGK